MDNNPVNLTDVLGLKPGDRVANRNIAGKPHVGWEVSEEEYLEKAGDNTDDWKYRELGVDEDGNKTYAKYIPTRLAPPLPIPIKPKPPIHIKIETQAVGKSDFKYESLKPQPESNNDTKPKETTKPTSKPTVQPHKPVEDVKEDLEHTPVPVPPKVDVPSNDPHDPEPEETQLSLEVAFEVDEEDFKEDPSELFQPILESLLKDRRNTAIIQSLTGYGKDDKPSLLTPWFTGEDLVEDRNEEVIEWFLDRVYNSIRTATKRNLPLGKSTFIQKIQRLTGIEFKPITFLQTRRA